MTTFFIPPLEDGAPTAEGTYRELRDQAEACIGTTSRERRIEGILCRRSGRDCQLRVGELDIGNGQTVTAIIQLGRDTYTVHHLVAEQEQLADPLVLHKSDVYLVTDFQ
jgi:hypothetical protein